MNTIKQRIKKWREPIYLVIMFIITSLIYTAFSGYLGILISTAFMLYNIGILKFSKMTGIATICFMLSDTVYSLMSYGIVPYINIICYTGSLIVFVAESIKNGNKNILEVLNMPKINKIPQTRFLVFLGLIAVTVTLSNISSSIEVTDIATVTLVSITQTLSIVVPIAIAFRNKLAYISIVLVYIIGSINSIRLLAYNSFDIVQTVETIFVLMTVWIAYKSIALETTHREREDTKREDGSSNYEH